MNRTYRFGRFELNPSQRQLLADDRPVPLGARAFDVLLALIERRERQVSKNELLDLVWPALVVEENNLQVQVSALRKLLGADVIATIPGRGYRFIPPLTDTQAGDSTGAGPPAVRAANEAAAGSTRVTNIAADLPQLFGRNADMAALQELLESHKLVTVVGAGGIGKSRLAQASANALCENWEEGVWMVELAGLGNSALLPNVVAQSARIALPGQGPALDELVSALSQRRLLIVLDNCEHLLAAAAALVQALLRGARYVTLLATSQEPLHLPEEQQFRVLPLAIPAAGAAAIDALRFGAVELFVERVRAADSRFALTDQNLPLVIDICRHLDGLPLAIELAAARVSTLGLRPVRDKLDARFKLLTGGARTGLRRHQTLRAALEWSHGLLDDAERAVFRRVGVFAGGFTIGTAQAVAADERIDEWAVLDHLSALVDKSLVVADPGDVPRYRLLESARAFALEQLAVAGETAAMLKQHATAMRSFLEPIDSANLDGEMRTDAYRALVLPELDNLRAAHAWAIGTPGEAEIAVALAAHSGALIDYAIECADWLLPLQEQVEAGAVDSRLAARYWRALCAGNMVPHAPRALQAEAAARAAALYEELGHPRRMFSSLIRLASYHNAQQREAAARTALDLARALIRVDWPPEFRLLLLRQDGTQALERGQVDEALRLFREEKRAASATGDWRLEVMGRVNFLNVLWAAGPLEAAADEACMLVDELRLRPATDGDMTTMYANLLGILCEAGRIDEASAAGREALPFMHRAQTYYFETWAYVFWRRGQHELAATLLGASDAEVMSAGVPLQINERRLIAQARPAMATALGPEAYTRLLTAGGALQPEELQALIREALAGPGGNDR